MQKSNGRPRHGSAKRDNYVKVGFNNMEKDRIEILSAKAGMNKAVYVRERALNDVIIAFLSEEEKQLLHELKNSDPTLIKSPIKQIPKDCRALKTRLISALMPLPTS